MTTTRKKPGLYTRATELGRARPVRITARVLRSPITWGLLALGIVVWLAIPEVAVRRGRARATACLAGTRLPRGPTLPDCAPLVRDFDFPTGYSHTRHDATYRSEELLARSAIDRYVDGAVGNPDAERLARGALTARYAQSLMEDGSQRLLLDELGPAVGAPHIGKLATNLGDRARLLEYGDEQRLWYLRRDVLEAAIVEGELDRATELAIAWSADEKIEADLLTEMGALLCITSPMDGYRLLTGVCEKRADKRGENIQRNYGELFAVYYACAAKAGVPAPTLPDESGGGDPDVRELRRLTELRAQPSEPALARTLNRVVDTLMNDPSPFSSRRLDHDGQPYARAMLLAATLVLSPDPIEPASAAKLARSREGVGEPPFAPRAVTLGNVLARPVTLYPIVSAAWLSQAADALIDLARAPNEAEVLQRAASGIYTLAAIEYASDGDVEAAIDAAQSGARWGNLGPSEAATSVATAAWVAGDAARALGLLRGVAPATAHDAQIERDALEALLLAATGDHESARSRATSLAQEHTSDVDLSLFARWTALALAPEAFGDPSEELALRPITSNGQADALARYRTQSGEAAGSMFTTWASGLQADANVRRAFRYKLFDHRGDMPALALPYLLAASRLLDEDTSAGGFEAWLDAVGAIDMKRIPLRSYAWMRMETARIVGNDWAADRWAERLGALRQLASAPEDLDAARFLRL